MELRQQHTNIYYYQQDEQGSTRYITDQKGNIKNSYQYDAFGSILERKESIPNRITYTGQQYDTITQQYYLRARYYNPIIGRFTQEDTYRGDGLNLYSYCQNNPVMYYDPSGYFCEGKGNAFRDKAFDFINKSGKVLYATSEIVLGVSTIVGGLAYIKATGGLGTFLGGGVVVAHGGNSLANGLRNFTYIFQGDWNEVGKKNFFKDNVYEPLGEKVGEEIGERLSKIGFEVNIEKSMEYGRKVGSLGYYGLDIYLGTKGTHNALKELNKATWTRGVFRTVGVGNMEVQIIEGASKNSSLLMNIGKDTLGYYFNARGLYNDVIKEERKESSVNEKDAKKKVEPILDGTTGVTQ